MEVMAEDGLHGQILNKLEGVIEVTVPKEEDQ
jgi:hypothetical protein